MRNLITECRAAGVALIFVLSAANVSYAGDLPSALLTAADFSGEHVVVKPNTPAAAALQSAYPNRLRPVPKAVVSLGNLHVELPTLRATAPVAPPATPKACGDKPCQLTDAAPPVPTTIPSEVQ